MSAPRFTFIEDEESEEEVVVEHLAQKIDMLLKAVQQNSQEIRKTRQFLLQLARKQHEEQLKQLKACQTAFQLNVDRDEELRQALAESADPWA